MRPIRISEVKSGDVFYEDVSGTKVRCEALENSRENETGYSLRVVTPLGEKSLFEAKGGRPLRLFRQNPAP
jgi:hypothetical protein